MLPTSIVMILSTAIAGAQTFWKVMNAVKNILAMAKMPGPITMLARRAEMGAGAAEYASGSQVWRGKTAVLTPKPTKMNIAAMYIQAFDSCAA